MVSNILIIGNVNSIHLHKLQRNLEKINKGDVKLDFFHLGETGEIGTSKVHFIQKYFAPRWYKIIGLSKVIASIDLVRSFSKLKKYELINIHYLTLHSFLLLPFILLKGKKLMISPWGSDVYRVKGIKKLLYSVVYQLSDYVGLPDTGFRTDVKQKFGVSSNKIIDVGFGSELIGYITNQKKIGKELAKEKLDFKNHLVIACGYNCGQSQNHDIMIDAIILNKQNLPQETVLFFLLTYGKKYDLKIQFEKLDNNGIKYFIFSDYLNNEELFEIQSATDIFIHIQDSDANSAFMQEFLLCNALVINGAWLTYEHLEKEGFPYVLVQEKNIASLSNAINKVLVKDFVHPDTAYAKKVISSFAWSVLIEKWYSFFKKKSRY